MRDKAFRNPGIYILFSRIALNFFVLAVVAFEVAFMINPPPTARFSVPKYK
jgi:hypothetical protein